jgi:hypothetical protein
MFIDSTDCTTYGVAQWLETVDERQVFVALHERVVVVLLQVARSPLGHVVTPLGEQHVDCQTTLGCDQGRDEHHVSHPIAQETGDARRENAAAGMCDQHDGTVAGRR